MCETNGTHVTHGLSAEMEAVSDISAVKNLTSSLCHVLDADVILIGADGSMAVGSAGACPGVIDIAIDQLEQLKNEPIISHDTCEH